MWMNATWNTLKRVTWRLCRWWSYRWSTWPRCHQKLSEIFICESWNTKIKINKHFKCCYKPWITYTNLLEKVKVVEHFIAFQCHTPCMFLLMILLLITAFILLITAAESEPEVNERGSSLNYREKNTFFYKTQGMVVKGARNCGYARMEELRCTVLSCWSRSFIISLLVSSNYR